MDQNDFTGAIQHILNLGFSHLKSRPSLNLKGVVVSCKYTDEISEDTNPEKRLDSLKLFSPFGNFVYSHYALNPHTLIYNVFFYKATELEISKTELTQYLQSLGATVLETSLKDGRTVVLKVSSDPNTLSVKRYKDMSLLGWIPAENGFEITFHYFDE